MEDKDKKEHRMSAVLCVDDESMVTDAIKSLLYRRFKDVDVVEIAQSAEEALDVIDELLADKIEIKAVVTDYLMPGMKGDELLVNIHRRLPETKKIMLTGQSNINGVKRAINDADLYRFLEKPWNNEDLLLTLKSAAIAFSQGKKLKENNRLLKKLNEDLEKKVAERTRELSEKNMELERLSSTDHLTRLYNRFKLDLFLKEEIQRSLRYHKAVGVILMDIDFFKKINDAHGHQIGDQVLVEIAGILTQNCRANDRIGRWGGEEFLVVCPESTPEGILKVAEKLRIAIESFLFSEVVTLTASFGVTLYRQDDTPDKLVARADKALYQAKENGRNQVKYN